jgi:NADP-dependent 3-hydroxy acid dehydrogenase YdfG
MLIEDIYKQIWSLSPTVNQPESYNRLSQLTQLLIELYAQQGRVNTDPFNPSRERELSLPTAEIELELHGSICLVTGGLGCVGTALVAELLKFNIDTVIVLDNKKSTIAHASPKVIYVTCDIRNMKKMQQIFSLYQPTHVFHATAQRDPGLAESEIKETVSINVMGTRNVVIACENTISVKQMVSASTGKASRYYTEEVYAGTKKMGEFIIEKVARNSRIKYSMIRCTHILDNSLMNETLKGESLTKDYVSIHSPGKYVTAQNAREAAYLMLNAFLQSEVKQCKFLLVRHLAWPVESLEMALYYIVQSGKPKPVIFQGNPLGYTEKFFRGQLDWSSPLELNLLINVYERKHAKLNEAQDIIISIPCPTDSNVLEEALIHIQSAVSEADIKKSLADGLREVVRSSLNQVDKNDTIKILKWGTDASFMKIEKTTIEDFDYLLPLLWGSLEFAIPVNRVYNSAFTSSVYASH